MARTYEIVVTGTASPLVRAAFEEFDVDELEGGRIRLVGVVADEAALHGVLHRMQDLRLAILELRRLEED
ncbi:hypothetical protein [Solicola gregarius]|uniref:Uncharacterized protein n=1 Tax=Solicola gregarius TaxID=2908642 RepID=A0AA46TDX8_9ACTN|nr:hypothetical protein [Solicola gregarius]UYM03547.1 hypothetical protein L0C25_13370 [Solicola gregarius]